MSQLQGLDADAMAAWMEAEGILTRPMTFERVGLGQSNLTFLATDEGGTRRVLRRPPLGKILASAHDVAREHRILSALQGTDVPVPTVYGLCEDPAVTDVPVMIVDFVDGEVLNDKRDSEQLGEEQRHRVGLALVEALASIHAVDLEGTSLTDLGSHSPYGARQLRRWAGQWEKSKTRELPVLDDLTRRLSERDPGSTEITLVHGDGHLRNMIIDPQDASIRAVLDWELCTLGDPIADLGTLLAYWPSAGEPLAGSFSATTVPGFASRDELVTHYAQVTGRDVSAVPFWHALGVWKVAIIAEGVRRRQLDDERNLSASGHFPAEVIDVLAAHAHEILDAESAG